MTATRVSQELQRFVVEPASSSSGALKHLAREAAELWHYRELLGFLAWRDLKVRYKQTVIGILWSVLQPLLLTAALTVFLGRLGNIPSSGMPYALFVFVAILPWQLFSHALLTSSTSLVANQDLIKKIYFPRLLIPLASLVVGLVNFGVGVGVLMMMCGYFGIHPSLRLVWAPFFLLWTTWVCLGVGCYFGAINARYRDVQLVMPFLSQLWLFVTPVMYPTSLVPDAWCLVYALNPLVGAIDGLRWSVLGVPPVDLRVLLVSLSVAVLVGAAGLRRFIRAQELMADVI